MQALAILGGVYWSCNSNIALYTVTLKSLGSVCFFFYLRNAVLFSKDALN